MRLLPADFWTTELRELHKTDSISVMVYGSMPDRHADYTKKLRKSASMRAILVESVQFSGSGPLKKRCFYMSVWLC